MTHQTNCASFHDEKDLAICSLNGTLHIWDTESGTKKTEFTPASHLTSSFTSLAWKIQQKIVAKKQSGKASKRKSRAPVVTDSCEDVIALGTATGDVLLYDVKAGDLLGKLDGQHTDRVNCICWDPNDRCLLSCSEDQHIVHWDLASYKAICKWQGDKRGVKSISIGPHKTLLSAGKMIKLWDLESKTLLRKFTGHSSPVSSLLFANTPSVSTREDATPLEMVEGLYFLSAAIEDRVVNVWQIQKKHKKIAVASFSINSPPVAMSVKSPASKAKPITLMVLTDAGDLNIFSHILNGQLKKPLDVQMTVSVVDPSAKKIKIISATFCDDPSTETATIIIAYGTTLKVIFERINLDNHTTSEVVLIRKDPMKIEVKIEENALKMRQPIRNKDEVTMLAPGVPGHGKNTSATVEMDSKSKKKRKKMQPVLEESEMTMEQRAQALSVRRDSESEKPQPPRADSLSVLLTQGLQSNDKEILNRVLQNTNEVLIHNTIARLPLSLVISLIQDLTTRMKTAPAATNKFIGWLRETLKVHSSYLMTFPDLVPVLSQLHQMMEARTEAQNRFLKLEGKLELITSQIKQKKKSTTSKAIDDTPLCVYDDESSDEQEDVLLDDLPDDNSDSDEASGNEWDGLEEMEIDGKDDLAMDEDETDSGVANEDRSED